jgi:hypothetical protein
MMKMKIPRLTLANLLLAAILLLTPLLVDLTSSAPYDPWYDLDENGKIDIFDVVRIASTYGTTGDPGKNVNVTNWPVERELFPEDLILRAAFFSTGGTYRRDLVDSTTYQPPSSWPGVISESDFVGGTLNAAYQLVYDKTFTHQKIPLDAYQILGSPTATVTINVTTFTPSHFKFDCLAHLGKVSPDGTWVELAFLGNTTMEFLATLDPAVLFTWTMSYAPNPPLEAWVEPHWRLAIRLEIYGQRYPSGNDTDFGLEIMFRRNMDDFVVDIPIVKGLP